jgi:hypothetical protein
MLTVVFLIVSSLSKSVSPVQEATFIAQNLHNYFARLEKQFSNSTFAGNKFLKEIHGNIEQCEQLRDNLRRIQVGYVPFGNPTVGGALSKSALSITTFEQPKPTPCPDEPAIISNVEPIPPLPSLVTTARTMAGSSIPLDPVNRPITATPAVTESRIEPKVTVTRTRINPTRTASRAVTQPATTMTMYQIVTTTVTITPTGAVLGA